MDANDQRSLFELEKILEPIAEGRPAGDDSRLDITPQSLYFRLRDARSEARAAERVADNDPSAEAGAARHWKEVRDLALDALTGHTKDLEIAAWLTESLVRSEGLSGLTAGAQVMSGLVTRYWSDGLFPEPDEEGMAVRVAPLAGLNGQGSDGTLMQPLRKIVLFERADGAPVTYWQFEQAEETESLGDAARKAQRLASGVLPFAALEAEAQSSGRAHLAVVLRDVAAAAAAWQALDQALTAAAGDQAPSAARMHDLLAKLRRTVERYVPQPEAPPEQPPPAEKPAAPGEGAAPVQPSATPTREEMLQQLSRIAAHFRISEPHSPLSYTLDDAVRRARMGLPELLKEMLPELPARTAVLSGLGIKPPAD